MKVSTTADLPATPFAASRTCRSTIARFLAFLLVGALLTVVTAAIWWLAFLLGWASPTSLDALLAPFHPVLMDLARFLRFNLTQNLPFVILAVGVFAVFEISFRRQVSAGNSPAGTLSLFKAVSLLLGLLTMAISLHGVLTVGAEQGQDPRALIGSLYFKFGLWVLNAVLMVARYVWFENTQPAAAHE